MGGRTPRRNARWRSNARRSLPRRLEIAATKKRKGRSSAPASSSAVLDALWAPLLGQAQAEGGRSTRRLRGRAQDRRGLSLTTPRRSEYDLTRSSSPRRASGRTSGTGNPAKGATTRTSRPRDCRSRLTTTYRRRGHGPRSGGGKTLIVVHGEHRWHVVHGDARARGEKEGRGWRSEGHIRQKGATGTIRRSGCPRVTGAIPCEAADTTTTYTRTTSSSVRTTYPPRSR